MKPGSAPERWQDLWPFFASSLHQAGAANRGQGSLISLLKPVAASAPALVHSPPLHRRSLPNWPAENGCILANGERQLSISLNQHTSKTLTFDLGEGEKNGNLKSN